MKQRALIIIFLISTSLFAQKEVHPIFNDENTIKCISEFIKKRELEYNKFKTKGYVVLSLLFYNRDATQLEVKFKFQIKDQYFVPKYTYSNSETYIASTTVENKLVILKADNLIHHRITKRKKKKILRQIKETFGESQKLILRDSSGTIIGKDNSFFDESFNIHGGSVILIRPSGEAELKPKD